MNGVTSLFGGLKDSLRKLVEENLTRPQKDIFLLCEIHVRDYDPCFSCSLH
jgi:coenzyme F420-reducing hydrogenase alpha subunit